MGQRLAKTVIGESFIAAVGIIGSSDAMGSVKRIGGRAIEFVGVGKR